MKTTAMVTQATNSTLNEIEAIKNKMASRERNPETEELFKVWEARIKVLEMKYKKECEDDSQVNAIIKATGGNVLDMSIKAITRTYTDDVVESLTSYNTREVVRENRALKFMRGKIDKYYLESLAKVRQSFNSGSHGTDCRTISEFAEKYCDMDKTTMSNYLRIYDKFFNTEKDDVNDDIIELADRFRMTQLLELISLTTTQFETAVESGKITPISTIATIRKIVKSIKNTVDITPKNQEEAATEKQEEATTEKQEETTTEKQEEATTEKQEETTTEKQSRQFRTMKQFSKWLSSPEFLNHSKGYNIVVTWEEK